MIDDRAPSYDIVVVGGGIVGLATAMAVVERSSVSLAVIEAEADVASHQTGHNSGVIHSGLYYRPGSLKARNCQSGRDALEAYCESRGVPFERCGKVVVATEEEEIPRLEALRDRGMANGLNGLVRLDPAGVREIEPHVAAVAALRVPQTGIVDYNDVSRAFADDIRARGGTILTATEALGCVRGGGDLVIETSRGPLRCGGLVNCAGLQSDRVARLCGVDPGLMILPFRGEYYELKPHAEHLVRHLVYPVPDPRLPFLGVHFTRMIHGGVEAGPNAVLALARHGYRQRDVSPADLAELARFGGFWRMGARWWRTGIAEQWRSWSTRAFVRSLQRLVPEIEARDVVPGSAGIRAQAVEPSGALVDDFRIVEAERMVHVLNAPSPAATASISIGRAVAAKAMAQFGIDERRQRR